MNTTTPTQLLERIAQIQRMESGKLCIMRQGKSGPFYNLQSREHGKTVSRYVPRDQVDQVSEHTANYRQFQDLANEYAQKICEQTRRERTEGVKKKTGRKDSSRHKMKNSRP